MNRKFFWLSIFLTGIFFINTANANTFIQSLKIGDINAGPPPTEQTNWATNPNWDPGHVSSVHELSPMVFNQFNPINGTLNSVTLQIDGAWTGILRVQNLPSSTTDTDISHVELQIRMAYDVFNDYDGNAAGDLIELSGFSTDSNYDASLDSSFSSPVSITLAPGDIQESNNLTAAIPRKTITYTVTDTELANFIGSGQWNMGCFARSDDEFITSGGSPFKGHSAWAECSVQVIYDYTPPQSELACSTSLVSSGLGITGAVTGDETCDNLEFVETMTCTGGLDYTLAASTPGCSVTQGPDDTYTASCTAALGSETFVLITGITGNTAGSCSSTITSMSCSTPSGQTLIADTSRCQDSYDYIPPPKTTLACSISYDDGIGVGVTGTVSGDETCDNLEFVETVSCSGDLVLDIAAITPGCTVAEGPDGTFTASCTAALGSETFVIIKGATGTEGSCTSSVASMSCATPSGQNLIADTSDCKYTPPVPIPTFSEWMLILLTGLLGLVGYQASRRSS